MQALLSDHWYAVRHLKPQLRGGIQALHRKLRGRQWVLLSDPVSQRFHRVTPRVWQVLSLFDGQRTLDDIWDAACVLIECADAPHPLEPGIAVTQTELVQLVSTLHANDLLRSQVSPDVSEVFERHQRQERMRVKQAWLNPMSLRLPLLHPDAWFDKHAALARLLFTWPMLIVWLVLVTPAGFLAWHHWAELTENLSDRVLSASNLALLWFIYPIVKSIHEWAHGMAVKAWGGTVREVGIMFIFFSPVPYVDASASYRFSSKWARATVAAAGILAELVLGALAMYVWVLAQPGLVTALAFNVVLIAGVSTLLINGNPLMRYDGYFIACDVLELPNLAQRAAQYRTYLVDRYVLGSEEAQPPVGADPERWILLFYAVAAPLYQLSVAIGVMWFVAGQYLLVGAIMAMVAVWSTLVLPIWRGWKHLAESAPLTKRRDVAMRRAVAMLVLVLGFLLLVPMPFHAVHQAVVWLPDEAIVRAEGAGHISQVWRQRDELAMPGQTLLALDSPALLADLGKAAGAVAHTTAELRQAEMASPARAQALHNELVARDAALDEAARKVSALDVTVRTKGHWMPAQPVELQGRYVKRGEVLGYLIDGPSRLVRVAITQEDMNIIRTHLAGVEVRLANDMGRVLRATVKRQVSGGKFDLVSPALGTSGGGEIGVDPAQGKGTRSLQRVFDMEIALLQPSSVAAFGDRAYVRFDLGATPLARQWFLRLRQIFLSRLSL